SDIREGSAGAGHGGELEFLFGTRPEGQVWDEADQAVADLTADYWVRFARTGDPNGDGAPAWRPLSEDETAYLHIEETPETRATAPLQDEVRARARAASAALWRLE